MEDNTEDDAEAGSARHSSIALTQINRSSATSDQLEVPAQQEELQSPVMNSSNNGIFNQSVPFSKLRTESISSIIADLPASAAEEGVSRKEQQRDEPEGGSNSRLGRGLQRAHASIINTISSFVNHDDLSVNLLPHEEAALLIEYTRDGHELNIAQLSATSRFCYRLRKRYQPLFRFVAWSLIVVHIFQRPVWTFANTHHDWHDGDIYPSFQVPYLPLLASSLLTLVCLIVLWGAWLLDFGFKRYTTISYLSWLFFFMLLVKTVTAFIDISDAASNERPLFSASPAEAIMLLLIEPMYDKNISYLMRTVPKFALLMVALAAIICAYTALGFLIFDPNSQEAIQYFNFYGTSVWNMLMVLNGSNWPTPMIPAFMNNRAYCLYFYLYLIICDWGLLNLVLGFIYLFFRIEQRDIAHRQEVNRAAFLVRAFRIMDTEGMGFLTYDQTDQLLEEIYRFYEIRTKFPSKDERHECILQLDIQSNNMIDEHDFQFIEEKCFPTALKIIRAKRRKFTRYIHAHVRSRLQSTEEEWVPHPSSLAMRPSSARPSSVMDDSHLASRWSTAANVTARASLQRPSGNSVRPNAFSMTDLTKFDEAKTQQHSATDMDDNAAEVGASRISTSVRNSVLASKRHTDVQLRPGSELIGPQKLIYFSKTMTEASDYAGQIEDPKLLNFYRSIEMEQRIKREEEEQQAKVAQYSATVAMQVDSIYFDILCDTVLAVLGIIFLAGATANAVIYLYLVLMMVELLLKLFVKGGYRYLKSNRNSIDGAITVSLLIVVIVRSSTGVSQYTDRLGLRGLIMLRTLLFPRNVLVTNGFKAFRRRHRLAFQYAFNSAGHVTFMLLVLFVMMYSFAALGQSIFGGTISRDGSSGEELDASSYGQGEYWPLNFNDLPSGMVTMFVLLIVNNMHVTASGFVAVRGQWSQVFFALWYALGVLFLLNVVTAVFLNQFAGYLEKLSLQRRQDAEARAIQKHDEEQERLRRLQDDLVEDGLIAAVVEPIKTPIEDDDIEANVDSTNANVAPQQSCQEDVEAEETYLGVPRISATGFLALNLPQLQDDESPQQNDGDHDQRPSSPLSLAMGEKNTPGKVGGDHGENTVDSQAATSPPSSPGRRMQKAFSLRGMPLTPSKKTVQFISSMMSVSADPDDDFVGFGPITRLGTSSTEAIRADASGDGVKIGEFEKDERKEDENIVLGDGMQQHRKRRVQSERIIQRTQSELKPETRSRSKRAMTALDSVEKGIIPESIQSTRRLKKASSLSARSFRTIKTNYSSDLNGAGAPSASSALFSNSIFASDADREKLQQWVERQYRRSRKLTSSSQQALDSSGDESDDFMPRNTQLSVIRESEASISSSSHAGDGQSDGHSYGAATAPQHSMRHDAAVCSNKRLSERRGDSLFAPRGHKFPPRLSDRADSFKRRSSASRRPIFTTRAQTLGVQDDQDDEFEDVDDLEAEIVIDLDVHRGDDLQDPAASEDERSVSNRSSEIEGWANSVNPLHSAQSVDARQEVHEEHLRTPSERKSTTAVLSRGLARLDFLRKRQKKSFSNPWNHLGLTDAFTKQSILDWMRGSGDKISRQAKAAVLIQFARDGEEHSIFSSQRGLFCFRLRTRLSYLFRFASLVFAALRFFERPLWTFYRTDWTDNAIFPTSGVYLLSPTAMLGIKLPILVIMLFGILLELGYKESTLIGLIKYLTPMRAMRYSLLTYCIAQILMLVSVCCGAPPTLVTITSCASILYVLWFNRRSLQKFKIVLHVIPRLSQVLALFFLIVMIFAGVGPFVFNLSGEGGGTDDDGQNSNTEEYFNSLSQSVWSIFVAITSSDFPSQILPSYRNRRENCIFFITFMTIGSFGLLNLIIVVVLVEFQKASVLASDIQRASRQVLLMRAFEVLDHERKGFVERKDIMLLLDELYQHYSDFTKAGIPQGAARKILIDILDVDGDGFISLNDFLYFLDVTRIKVSIDTPHTFFENLFPRAAQSVLYLWLKRMVVEHYFDLATDSIVSFLVMLNFIINSRNPYIVRSSSQALTHLAVFVMLFEMVVRLVVRGYHNYRRSFRNKVDGSIAIIAVLALLAGDGYEASYSVNGFIITVRILLVLRLILYPRNLRFMLRGHGLKRFARLLRRVFTKIYTLGMVFLCSIYIFASVGVFAYGGLINKSSTNNNEYDSLSKSDYALNSFWGLNFNDFTSAWITLFSCLHVSDFDVIATGFTSTTSNYSRLYFTAWYIVGVLLILNILKSFFLGEFLSLFLNPRVDLTSNAGDGGEAFRTSTIYQMYTSNEMSKQHTTNQTMRSRLIERLNNGDLGQEDIDVSKHDDQDDTPATAGAVETANPLHSTGLGESGASFASTEYNSSPPRQQRNGDVEQPAERESNHSARDTFVLESVEDLEKIYNADDSKGAALQRSNSEIPRGKIAQFFSRSATYDPSSPARMDDAAAGGGEENLTSSQPKMLGELKKTKTNRYFASTAKVKHLDGKEKELLRNRIRDLAQSGGMNNAGGGNGNTK